MAILPALLLAASVVLLGDVDGQPACRQRCDDAWSADLAACEASQDPNAADQCRDDANERHQDCLDRCDD